MKYIDAEKLIANLERQNVDKKVIEPVIRIITSLQQEQPECGSSEKPNNPAEWSEEDEEHLDSIIESYKELLKDYKACHEVDYIPYNSKTLIRNVVDDVNFLKSLRLQPHWKPSDK